MLPKETPKMENVIRHQTHVFVFALARVSVGERRFLMGEGGEEKGTFSPSALSPFRFHLSPFPPETPDTQAIFASSFP